MGMKIRLHQFLQRAGAFPSRAAMVDAVKKGEVTVAGRVAHDIQFDFNPEKKPVEWKGKKLEMQQQSLYLMLDKPKGYLSSRLSVTDIELGKRSVFELIDLPEELKNSLFCAGRLDEDSEGMLLLTNDGKLGKKLTDPSSGISKTYHAVLMNDLSPDDVKRIKAGLEITLEENGVESKHTARPTAIESEGRVARITLTEGKKREVRRIFEAVGNRVQLLQRIAIGNLTLDELKIRRGEYASLTARQLEKML